MGVTCKLVANRRRVKQEKEKEKENCGEEEPSWLLTHTILLSEVRLSPCHQPHSQLGSQPRYQGEPAQA